MQDSIKSAISSGHGNAIVYAGAIGLLLSDVIPTPADGVYFWLMKKERDKYINKQITAKQYWTREAIAYYGLNPIWWGLVLGALYYTKGDYTNKLKVGLGIISAGAVARVLYQNIKEDETTKAI